MTCVQVVSKDVTNILSESECAHLLSPPSTQECNDVDCWQEWILGEWTQVRLNYVMFLLIIHFQFKLSRKVAVFLSLMEAV